MMKRFAGLVVVALGAFMIGGVGVAAAGDHLKCYKVKDKTPDNRNQIDPAFNKRPVTEISNTTLNSDSGCTVDNRKAKLCCDAVEKDGGPATGDTIHNHFCCYKLKCVKPYANTSMSVNDQFRGGGPGVTLTKPYYLCAPGL